MAERMLCAERKAFHGRSTLLDGVEYTVSPRGTWYFKIDGVVRPAALSDQQRLDARLRDAVHPVPVPPAPVMTRALRKHCVGMVLSTNGERLFIVTSEGDWCLASGSGAPLPFELRELDAALASLHASSKPPVPVTELQLPWTAPRCAVNYCDGRATDLGTTFCLKHQLAGMRGVEAVDHPAHYGGSDDPFEVIKVLEAWQTPDEHRGFLQGNVIKYLARAERKNGDEDRRKAAWYADRLKQFTAKGSKT